MQLMRTRPREPDVFFRFHEIGGISDGTAGRWKS